MKNADMPAMSQSASELGYCVSDDVPKGLTKLEYAAIKIMAGFASSSSIDCDVDDVSRHAIKWANALLKGLDK